MTKKQTIEAFCALASKVSGEVFNGGVPSDCFCTGPLIDQSFSMSDELIKFIFDAVTEKIERMTNEPN